MHKHVPLASFLELCQKSGVFPCNFRAFIDPEFRPMSVTTFLQLGAECLRPAPLHAYPLGTCVWRHEPTSFETCLFHETGECKLQMPKTKPSKHAPHTGQGHLSSWPKELRIPYKACMKGQSSANLEPRDGAKPSRINDVILTYVQCAPYF